MTIFECMRNAAFPGKLFPLFFLVGLTCWAGQSIVLSSGSVGNLKIPAQPANGPCRMEFSVHDWPVGVGDSHPMDASACGFSILIYGNGGSPYFVIQDNRTNYGASCRFNLYSDNFDTYKFITIRFQRDPVLSINTCEAWDALGNYYTSGDWGYWGSTSASYTATSGTNSSGACVSGSGWWGACVGGSSILSTAYYRIYTTTVAAGSTPPTTAQSLAGCLVSWKFDLGNNTGSLADSCSAGPYNASVLVGKAAYAATPYQNLVVAVAKTTNIPAWDSWATWVSARLNYSNGLDGTSSYSQNDATPNVSCSWSFNTGPMTPAITGSSTCLPSYTPTVFGEYDFTLQATDQASNVGTATLGVGAVAYDDNGVVIPSDPRVTQIFGPMIAFGRNPWGYADWRDYTMVGLQQPYLKSWHLDNPSWSTFGQGTVSYSFSGIGFDPGTIPGARLTSAIAAGSTSISIDDAAKIPGLAHLPNWILVGATTHSQSYYGQLELIRICAATATSGPATLTVCYDGRGMSGWTMGPGNAKYLAAQDWQSGAVVGEYRISGTGTLFASDPNHAICAAGVPGPPGPVVYSTGTVTVRPGSTSVTGGGTTWNSANSVSAGSFIRITATHAGGTAFVFWSIISSVADTTHMSLDRPLPSDVDTGPFSYKITGYRNLSLEFQFTDPVDGLSTQQLLQGVAGCESETAMFGATFHDIPLFNPSTFSGVRYTTDDQLGINQAAGWGPNFYGSGLALYSFYLRSGYKPAYTLHQWVDENWITSPETGGGWPGGFTLILGGGAVGAATTLAIDPGTHLHWSDFRQFARMGAIGSVPCDADDARDTGYAASWLALAALFDPSSSQRAIWTSYLGPAAGTVLAREQSCKRSDNSWANGFLFNTSIGPLTVVAGSTMVTGNRIPSSACYGVASGTVNVTNGSTAFTGTGLVNGSAIIITGRSVHRRQVAGREIVGGQSDTASVSAGDDVILPVRMEFTQTGGKSGILSGEWPGATGTFPYIIENNANQTTIGTSSADPMLKENWGCTWVDSGHIILNRPWDGPSSNSEYVSQGNIVGYGQQPYMLGIKTQAFRWASMVSDPATSDGFAALAGQAAEWIQSTGYDPQTQGLYYGALFQACEPVISANLSPFSSTRQPGCNQSLDANGVQAARALAPEAGAAFGVYYAYKNYSADARAWGDLIYGSIYGYCPFTAPGYYCDSNYVNVGNLLSNSSLGSFKWPGFFFGMGMAHQWPAARFSTPATAGR